MDLTYDPLVSSFFINLNTKKLINLFCLSRSHNESYDRQFEIEWVKMTQSKDILSFEHNVEHVKSAKKHIYYLFSSRLKLSSSFSNVP